MQGFFSTVFSRPIVIGALRVSFVVSSDSAARNQLTNRAAP